MANQKQLDILNKGVDAWYMWRVLNRTIKIELRKADLPLANLQTFDLSESDLREANIIGANLRGARLIGADLRGADLRGADLSGANLRGADLSGAYLHSTILNDAVLTQVKLETTWVGNTTFVKINLNEALGLDEVEHGDPSYIDTHTIQRFKGKLPEKFLRGCGLSDWEIESAKLYNPDLTNEQILNIQYRMYDLRATQAVQVSPLFISYSHTDAPFVNQLDKTLVEKGIRFWRDIQDMTSGRMETQIDRAIRQNPTVLLVLSKNSLNSDWVQHEVRKARELEKELGRDTLCPVALDASWKSAPWPARIMEQIMEYNILDFSGWKEEAAFQSKFSKLLSGLDLFYKKPKV